MCVVFVEQFAIRRTPVGARQLAMRVPTILALISIDLLVLFGRLAAVECLLCISPRLAAQRRLFSLIDRRRWLKQAQFMSSRVPRATVSSCLTWVSKVDTALFETLECSTIDSFDNGASGSRVHQRKPVPFAQSRLSPVVSSRSTPAWRLPTSQDAPFEFQINKHQRTSRKKID